MQLGGRNTPVVNSIRAFSEAQCAARDLFAAVPAELFLLVVDYLGTEAVEVVVSILGRDSEVRNQQFVHTHGCVVGHYLTELSWGTNQAGVRQSGISLLGQLPGRSGVADQ